MRINPTGISSGAGVTTGAAGTIATIFLLVTIRVLWTTLPLPSSRVPAAMTIGFD
jgi:hypothetical protein